MQVTKEQIDRAREADLYSYLVNYHGGEIIPCGNAIRLKGCDSVYIKPGYYGYMRFSTGERGNGIDLLTRHLGYSFTEAVEALAGCRIDPIMKEVQRDLPIQKACSFPEPTKEPFRRVYAYLTRTRGISSATVTMLVKRGLLYQDDHGNACFVNEDRTFCEVRGTLSMVRYHRTLRSEIGNCAYWSFAVGDNPKVAYVCEGAIDAISLYELLRNEVKEPALYCGIGGVGNVDTIKRIEDLGLRTVLAVDNDVAGKTCREFSPQLETMIPTEKDWNEDLQARSKI